MSPPSSYTYRHRHRLTVGTVGISSTANPNEQCDAAIDPWCYNSVWQQYCFHSPLDPIQWSQTTCEQSVHRRANDHAGDRAILMELFHATFSAQNPWNNHTNWGDESVSVCCWFGVTCSADQRVLALRLFNNGLYGTLPSNFGNLTELVRLVLAFNDFKKSHIDPLYSLRKLRFLDVQHSNFVGTLPPDFAIWSNMICLALSHNDLAGRLPSTLHAMNDLKDLELSSIGLRGELPGEISLLRNLRLLRINQNDALRGSIPVAIGDMSHLIALTLNNNRLNGSIPMSICNLSNLTMLGLSDNALSGPVPPCINKLRALEYFAIPHNELQGPILEHLCEAVHLRHLYLLRNQFSGSIPMCVSSWTKLERLAMDENEFDGTLPEMLGTFFPNLLELSIRGNGITGKLPQSLVELKKLVVLDVSYNLFHDIIPELPSSLTHLVVEKNNLVGLFPHLPVSGRNLVTLQMGANHFDGPLPSWLPALSELRRLELWGNQFSGTIPANIGQLSKLETLFLSANNLTGKLPPEMAQLSQLTQLTISENNFVGEIPSEFANLHNLHLLDVSNNAFKGELGLWIRNIRRVAASNNIDLKFEQCFLRTASDFPCISRSDPLSFLDLSYTNMSISFRKITQTFGASGLISLNLAGNDIQGVELSDLYYVNWFNANDGSLVPRHEAFMSLSTLNLFGNANLRWDFSHDSIQRPPPIPDLLQTLNVASSGVKVGPAQMTELRRLPFVSVLGREGMGCPSTFYGEMSGRQVDFILSPDQYGFFSCLCEPGKYLRSITESDTANDHCALCPLNTVCKCCIPCPSGTNCTPEVTEEGFYNRLRGYDPMHTRVAIQPGMFPVSAVTGAPAFPYTDAERDHIVPPIAIDELSVVQCYRSSLCVSDRANNTLRIRQSDLTLFEFRCADRTDPTSFMCSRCDNSSFYWFSACRECAGAWASVLSLIAVFALFAFFWRRDWRSMSGATMTALFYLQLSPILEDFHSSKRTEFILFQFVRWLTNTAYFKPTGLECLFGDSAHRSYAEFWFAVSSVVTTVVLCWIGHRIHSYQNPHESLRRLRDYSIGRLHFFLYVLYFPVSYRIISVFNCRQVPGTAGNYKYLDGAPWVSCHSNHYTFLVPWAILGVCLYVIAFPVYLFVVLYRARYTLSTKDDTAVDRFGFLFIPYRRVAGMHKWFPLVSKLARWVYDKCAAVLRVCLPVLGYQQSHTTSTVIGIRDSSGLTSKPYPRDTTRYEWELYVSGARKLALATVFGVMRFDSAWTPVLVLVVLGTSLSLHARLKPYKSTYDRILETVFLSSALVIFMLDVLLLDVGTRVDNGSDTIAYGRLMQSLWGLADILAVCVVFVPVHSVRACTRILRACISRSDVGAESRSVWHRHSHRATSIVARSREFSNSTQSQSRSGTSSFSRSITDITVPTAGGLGVTHTLDSNRISPRPSSRSVIS
jgi:Leucine-rich repeat (LRR) protein